MCLCHPLEEVSGEAPAKTHFQGPKGTEMLFAGIAFVSVNDSGISVSGNPSGELQLASFVYFQAQLHIPSSLILMTTFSCVSNQRKLKLQKIE